MFMDRPIQTFDIKESPPSEAWLFAQEIHGKPIPRIVSSAAQAKAKRDELERLAQVSTSHASELRKLQIAEVEAPPPILPRLRRSFKSGPTTGLKVALRPCRRD
jgi:hypothetical protein